MTINSILDTFIYLLYFTPKRMFLKCNKFFVAMLLYLIIKIRKKNECKEALAI